MPTLPFNLLWSVFCRVPSHHFLAIHAKSFFTLRTELSFFTLLPCPLAATKVTLMYIPGKKKQFFKLSCARNLFPFKHYSCWVAIALYLIKANTDNVGGYTVHSLTGFAVKTTEVAWKHCFLIQVLLYSFYTYFKKKVCSVSISCFTNMSFCGGFFFLITISN